MAELTFAQSGRRNYTVPILVALVVLGIAVGLIYRFVAHQTIAATATQTAVYPIRETLKRQNQTGGFKVLNQAQTQEQGVYVITRLHIDNHIGDPLFLKDFTTTVTTTAGEVSTSAIEKLDLETVYSVFPDLKPMMGTPLLRESDIQPGHSAEGTLMLQYPITQAAWEQRQSATITIDFYHQPSITIPIPKP